MKFYKKKLALMFHAKKNLFEFQIKALSKSNLKTKPADKNSTSISKNLRNNHVLHRK